MGSFGFCPVLNVHHIPDFLAGVFGPVFWLCTVLTGLFMNHHVRHRSASWMGVIGILCIVIVLVWDYVAVGHPDYEAYQAAIGETSSNKCLPQNAQQANAWAC